LIQVNACQAGRAQHASMSSRPIAATLATPRPWGALVLFVGAVLWTAAMWPWLFARMSFGPICSGHGALFAVHCPACYAGALLAFLGVSILVLPASRRG
jgi:hypothetical protein